MPGDLMGCNRPLQIATGLALNAQSAARIFVRLKSPPHSRWMGPVTKRTKGPIR
jgi:hypothetical protein